MKQKKFSGAKIKIKVIKSKPLKIEENEKHEAPKKEASKKTFTPLRVGGMALSGGIMMRSAHFLAVAFDDGEKIHLESRKLKSIRVRHNFYTWPFVRGIIVLIEAFVGAFASYSFATKYVKPKPISHKIKRSYDCINFLFYTLVVVLVFDYVFIKLGEVAFLQMHPVLNNVASSVIFLLFFILAITIVYQSGEHLIFSYHGAEHKTINAYEQGAKLEPEEIKKYSRLHPRCGSIVGGFTIIIGSILTGLLSLKMNALIYFLLSFIVFMVSFSLAYELTLLLINNYKNIFARILLWPAFGFQALLTREPTSKQIRVAVAALTEVLKKETEENGGNLKVKRQK